MSEREVSVGTTYISRRLRTGKKDAESFYVRYLLFTTYVYGELVKHDGAIAAI